MTGFGGVLNTDQYGAVLLIAVGLLIAWRCRDGR